jgi:hypothetical protein
MNDRPEDAGHGALFKNIKKEKPSHPDYQGDCTLHGRKFWMSEDMQQCRENATARAWRAPRSTYRCRQASTSCGGMAGARLTARRSMSAGGAMPDGN